MKNTTTRNGNRQNILDASLMLFSQKGFVGTSMRDIATAVGIKAPSIYNHFSSKNEILSALLSLSGPNKMIINLKNTIENRNIEDSLTELVDNLIEIWSQPDDHQIMRLLLVESFRNEELRQQLHRSIFIEERDLLVQIFLKLRTRKAYKNIEPEILAEACLSKGLACRLELLLSKHPTELLPTMRQSLLSYFDYILAR